MADGSLLEAENVKKYFPFGGKMFGAKHLIHAVDGVSMEICEGETLGLVGESGCGKTTLGRLLVRLIEPTDGSIRFQGQDILKLDKKGIARLRRNIQIIFQDPVMSLNPRKTVRQIISAPYVNFKIAKRKEEIENNILNLLERVGLNPAEDMIDRYPHEFSGGQRQRISIARAMVPRPRFIVADEPVSSLDISIRAQILNLMKELQKELAVTYLFITHELSVVRSMCRRVAVMYLGKLVEVAETNDLFTHPFHPYTRALITATPIPDPERARIQKRSLLKGEVPSAINPPSGCRFHGRCEYRRDECGTCEPALVDVGEGHYLACHLSGTI